MTSWKEIMSTLFETTISATEFKAKCLELMEQGALRQLDRVHVTKRGKPFVTIEMKPETGEPAPTFDSIFGCMKGEIKLPTDFDLKTPAYTDAELDGFLQDTLDQIDELARRPRE